MIPPSVLLRSAVGHGARVAPSLTALTVTSIKRASKLPITASFIQARTMAQQAKRGKVLAVLYEVGALSQFVNCRRARVNKKLTILLLLFLGQGTCRASP